MIPALSRAQAGRINGFIYDSVTKAPLAFVSVVIKENRKGTVSDIDGQFSFLNCPAKSTLLVSYIGYKPTEVDLVQQSAQLSIALVPSGKELENVVITSGENPAHRVIRLMQLNKKKNDPDQQPSYKYNTYTVAALAAGDHFWNANKPDTQRVKKNAGIREQRKDTSGDKLAAELSRRFRENYLMLTESYTERIFRFPNQVKETVLATKVSGLKKAEFAITAANFQPFGFYKDYLKMNENAFVSPVINGSTGMYHFKLTDMIPHENDTSFIISFEPRRGKNFNGLKGVITINSAGYAIENVIASPADETGLIFSFRIQQKYKNQDGRWFPEQLNSTLTQKDIFADSVLLFWDSRCYISNVEIGMPVSRSTFSDVGLEFHPLAGQRPDTAWILLRPDTLNLKEKKTYETFEMLPPKYKNSIEKVNSVIKILAIEGLTYGKIDIPFKYILSGINKYESFRPGAGIRTNPSFSSWLTLEGFAGYGLRDKAWKYGTSALLTFNERTGTSIRFSYAQDITEPGNVDYFVRNGSVFSNQTLRNFQTYRMDSIQQVKVEFNTRLRPFVQSTIWMMNEQRNPAGYPYEFRDDPAKINYRQFSNTEIGIGFRLTRGENFVRMGRAKLRSKPPATQLMLQVSKGVKTLGGGDLDYTKAALQLDHGFRLKKLGFTSFQLEVGQTWGDLPYSYLFNTRSSRTSNKISIHIPNTFQTVGLYEFVADRTAALFIQHSFGNLLFKPANINTRPEVILVQNITYGTLSNREFHRNIEIKVPEKGLFETGLLLKNIYKKNLLSLCYLGLGGGVFYRYGHYALPKAQDNWVFKWGFNISF